MIAQGVTSGKIAEYLKKLRLERNKKWVKRKLAEAECHKRMMEYYHDKGSRQGN